LYCRLLNSIYCLCIALSLSACGTLSSIQYDADLTAAKRLARQKNIAIEVQDLAQPLVADSITPGIMVGVQTRDGQSHFFGFGEADKQTHQVPDQKTLFAIGSVSKGFLANIVAVMVADGRLRWDMTLEEVLPQAASFSPDAKKITIEQLATHTSGLPRQPMTLQTLAKFVAYLFTGNSFYDHFTDEYILEYLSSYETPSERVPQYSNIGYGLLGWVVKHVGQQTLDVQLARHVLGPLKLNNTTYQPHNLANFATRAVGYAGDQPKMILRGQPTPDWTFTPFMQGSAALYSNAEDLLQYTAAHLSLTDSVLSQAMQDTLTVRYPREREAAAVAWIVDEVGGEKIHYQIGLVAGYTTYIGFIKERNIAVVVLQNTFNWRNSVGHRLLVRMSSAADLQDMH